MSDEDRAYFDLANHSTSSYDGASSPTRLKKIPAQGYLRLQYGAPTAILPKRS